ncbi:hypothetical protein ERO13_A04G019100v2 [Gossypium hirsutum]|uniref:Uncharacterized protein isoform X1 n=10 Tax=Gossypium TaxID=3633 RepID=A0A1U8J8A6_GOSHI|nr:uncharacterized protein LOC107903348 isoform X1 [Gossypium hirsutum]KAB2086307.1 hypothetical protein ES319_A04G021500v1 [Gossypium barbadense]TYH21216.1 hypothetical protein ES288_A04G025600v1 [Gossypium darwinii]TYI31981.1 hypothetical protein ES332_A04G025300v1 [Gossypium tomentosum]TYJ38858.1 hypothetical protein E1A91_A04G022800v1 [Gossypium mustelinum]KAG4203973.1 hypothetical protein ERO13_A04G019100v2 [Gossypium hirsutum]
MKNSPLGEESSNMAHKLEAIHGGGGSIKVGTKGTISSLMTEELDSIKTPRQTPPRHKSQGIPASVACSSTTLKRLQPRKSLDGAGTSRGRNSTSYKSPQSTKNVHQMPILGSENVALERTPIRQKSDKKVVSNIVEVVDIKCGNSDRAWSTPITNRLKKLGFSKLSETIV